MRKYGLLAAAAGLALSGSLVRADFVISSNRVNNGATDTVTFTVTDTNAGPTTGLPNLVADVVALYAPTTFNAQSFPNNGLIINTDQSVSATRGLADYTDASATGSYVPAPSSFVNVLFNPAALLLDGSTVDTGQTTFNNGDKVRGISAAYGNASNHAFGSSATGGLVFAVAVVPAGNPVLVLQETPTGSDVPSTRAFALNFAPSATEFSADVASGQHSAKPTLHADNADLTAYSDPAVPEPASLSLIGIGVAGLIARRRRA